MSTLPNPLLLVSISCWIGSNSSPIPAPLPPAKPPPAAKSAAAANSAAPRWNTETAAHLLRRAGFGGTPQQVQYLAKLGRAKAVDYLVDYEAVPFKMDQPKLATAETGYAGMRKRMKDLDEEQRKKLQQRFRILQELNLREMTNWWVARMVATSRPLEEKMVLFWHGHFTSGIREVKRAKALFDQNELFRRMAVGNFRELLVAVSRNPAMLQYLNNAQNRKQKPNENYARELMELFTLGVGRYTEQEIKEAARAFTGWTIHPETAEYAFFGRAHDFGPKTFMGRHSNFDGTDIIDIILQQPACAEYMVKRLWRFFAAEDAPAPVVKSLARVFRDNKYEMKPLLRAMFRSDAFYSPKVTHAHVKSPVELVVGTLRALEVAPDDCTAFAAACRIMGQELFQPPNVKGWDGGLAWINTASLFNRYNLLGYIVYGTPQRPPQAARRIMGLEGMMTGEEMGIMSDELPDLGEFLRNQPPFDPMPIVKELRLDTPEKIVDHFVARLLQQKIAAGRRQILIDEVTRISTAGERRRPADVEGERRRPAGVEGEHRRPAGDSVPSAPQNSATNLTNAEHRRPAGDAPTPDAIRGVIHLIVSMPDYQLN